MAAWAGRCAFGDVLVSARAGDEEAFASLWRWLQPPLVRWLAVVAPGHVEDVASEVWLSVTRGLDVFEGGEGDFRGWVFTIARRRAIDFARRRARQPRLVAIDAFDIADPASSSSSVVDGVTELEGALALLQRLSSDQREAVALRVIVGMTVSETAAVLNKTECSVRVLCHRGLRTLAQQLDSDQFAEGVTA